MHIIVSGSVVVWEGFGRGGGWGNNKIYEILYRTTAVSSKQSDVLYGNLQVVVMTL